MQAEFGRFFHYFAQNTRLISFRFRLDMADIGATAHGTDEIVAVH
jgi:hypothetical protein